MASEHRLTMLGTGLIGTFYTMALHQRRGRDRVQVVYSRSAERSQEFAAKWGVPRWTTDLDEAIGAPDTDGVVVGLPNDLHLQAVEKAARAGKAVLCTKPLGRTAAEGQTGWLFPVGDEVAELGYTDMFADMLEAWDAGRAPQETFYDGYVVNAVIDAAYRSARSKRWEPVEVEWRDTARAAPGPAAASAAAGTPEAPGGYIRIKEERMPDGRLKVILKDQRTGEVVQR
ncbi:MAG: Gfo/Idh/MocA family oxidoreductase, partial [Candidatus Latescibacterota bacterium]